MNNLKTGDLLLCNHTKKNNCMSIFTTLIKAFTQSSYSHVAMVLKDPSFIHPTLKGLYVWESSWEGAADPQDGKIKLGVQITPLLEFIKSYKNTGHIIIRKVNCSSDLFSDTNLSKVHNVVYDKPYDIVPIDWIEAITKTDSDPKKTNRFWCSALIGYIYTKCGLLNPKTDWSILSPADFALSTENLNFVDDCSLSDTEQKLV